MTNFLRILHVEDSEDDWELIYRLLRKEWPDAESLRVESPEDLKEALQTRDCNLVLSDFKLPGFTGIDALETVKALKPQIPFIFVSGMMGEEIAIESLKNGAMDYVLKDRPNRLIPAVRRALREAEERGLKEELERRLSEAERLQTVSTLSTGISHDFNNILTIILGQASMLHTEKNDPQRVVQLADTISRAGNRAAAIVRQLMAFAQKSEGQAEAVDFNREVDQILQRLGHGIPPNVNLRFIADPSLPEIALDASQLEMILLNLISNAQEAMPNGGTITVLSRQVSAEECHFVNPLATGKYIRLDVMDEGCGMDAATREHIFEPFYTTKERSRGTGLGLPAVYGLMHALEGWISVDSVVDKGTVIGLFFPLNRSSPASITGPLPDSWRAGGGETVLVVEDEEDILFFVQSILEEEGYRVIAAQNYDEALDRFYSQAEDIHLALSDIGLPAIDGLTLCEKLRAHKPSLKIILSSGFSPKDFKERIDALGVEAFLPKPYSPKKLCQQVRAVLRA
jgi:two-component system cell cycle sensor histidine kinase/response regulator CckA